VLVATKASTICGSDIRAIYREHLGKGAEGYQGVIAGHEPAAWRPTSWRMKKAWWNCPTA